jgi:hypothetical protein
MNCVYHFLEIIVDILIIGGFIWFFINFRRLKSCEKEIEKLTRERNIKIEQLKHKDITQSQADGEKERFNEEYDVQIKELERKRRFILDKLPFIK